MKIIEYLESMVSKDYPLSPFVLKDPIAQKEIVAVIQPGNGTTRLYYVDPEEDAFGYVYAGKMTWSEREEG